MTNLKFKDPGKVILLGSNEITDANLDQWASTLIRLNVCNDNDFIASTPAIKTKAATVTAAPDPNEKTEGETLPK